jgi:hypothetical protein
MPGPAEGADGAEGIAAVAAALRAAHGRFAVLAGAGVSSSAGIVTGEDLLRGRAAALGDDPGEHPVGWYRARHGARPNYIGLLAEAAGTSPGAPRLPSGHFETAAAPSGAVSKCRRPTPAHRALAALVASGQLAPVVLTTNFDRLLELALARAGVRCTVAATLGSIARAVRRRGPGPGDRCLLVKLHGDYRDIGIRDTSAGKDTYHPLIDQLLDWVLGDYGLLVCGWSGAWDVALRAALERTATAGPAPTLWLLRGVATPEASRLIARRRALVARVASSDRGLTALAAAVADNGATGAP